MPMFDAYFVNLERMPFVSQIIGQHCALFAGDMGSSEKPQNNTRRWKLNLVPDSSTQQTHTQAQQGGASLGRTTLGQSVVG